MMVDGVGIVVLVLLVLMCMLVIMMDFNELFVVCGVVMVIGVGVIGVGGGVGVVMVGICCSGLVMFVLERCLRFLFLMVIGLGGGGVFFGNLCFY